MPNVSRITHAGETRSLKEWAAKTGLTASTIHARIHVLGWDVARALGTPATKKFGRGSRPGRPRKGAVRTCPPLKRHATKGAGYCRWWAAGVEQTKFFGPWGSDDCVTRYQRFQFAWSAGTALLPEAAGAVGDLVVAWLGHCEHTYRKRGKVTSEYHCNRAAMKHLNRLYGQEEAKDFNGRKLRAVREAMVGEKWARKTINDHVARIVRAFGWAATESLVPPAVHQALELVEALAPGRREELAEPEPVEPVPAEHIRAVLECPDMHPTPKRRAVLVAMIRTELLTGMRPGELCSLRADQIDRRREPWRYVVTDYNKMLHKSVERVVLFGPEARAVLAPFLAEAQAGEHVFRYPPWRRKASWSPVTTTGYRARIRRACKAAGVTVWTPNQLRHNRATEVMDRYEDDKAVAALLGNSPEVSRQVYAHRAGETVAARIAEATG